ncbi:3'-5' exonuclease [Streptomyces sp. NPDC092046]|uniref:3'-5' exonuclease n=1 Tax=Streptomyces sp. NPDC092046 TaxID=3366009 RepID=UPI00381A2A64
MSGGERVNAYDASCADCGGPVPAGAGLLRHGARGWEVFHPGHAPEPGPPPRGTHPGWHRRRLWALDIGSTGHRPGVDRIRSAALRGSDGTAHDWILDIGSDIQDPTGALPDALPDTHADALPGTVVDALPEPLPPPLALEELATLLTAHLTAGELLVVWFAPHVLSTLHAELLRHGLPPLVERLPAGVAPVCDPLVLDRHADRYRPGSRSLRAVAEWYGVPHATPGDPASDAAASLLVAQAVAACHPPLARLSRPALHTEQVIWYAEQTSRHPDALAWPFTPVEPLPWQPAPED